MHGKFGTLIKIEHILEAIMMKLEPELSGDAEQGLTASQFKIMKLLLKEDCTVSELSEHLGVTPGEVRTVTDRMYYAGWVIKNADEGRVRDVKISLSDKGILTYKKSWETRERLINKYFLSLDKDDQAKLIDILARMFKIN